MPTKRRLIDAYRFDGFVPCEAITGVFGDPKARVIHFHRREKKLSVHSVVLRQGVITIGRSALYAISPVEIHESIWSWRYAVFTADGVRK